MAAPRILPAEAPYPEDIAESFSRIMPPGMEPLRLFRTMARNPRVVRRMFAGSLLDKGSIGLRDREIVILRTCARCSAEYEWGVHVTMFAQRAGLSEADIAATLQEGVADHWSACDAALIRLADALHDHAALPDTAWEQLAAHFEAEQALELITLAGYYHTISFIANAARVECEEYAARFAQYRR